MRGWPMEKSAYRNEKWIIHDLAHDFELLDCWELNLSPTVTENSFFDFFDLMINFDLTRINPIVTCLLKFRFALGRMMKWDGPESWGTIPNSHEKSIKERLPLEAADINRAHQLKVATGVMADFKPVYVLHNEGLAEISNSTIYALLHMGLTRENKMVLGVHVKFRGVMSKAYMASIKPFRHILVYPVWLNAMQTAWNEHSK